MEKAILALKDSFAKVRTGRAQPGLLDHVRVDYYGTETPISQVASVTATDAHTLAVSPWEKGMAAKIDKAIRESDLGLNPVVVGETLKVPLPPLSEERRKELVKVVRQDAEGARVAIRNIRREAIHKIKVEVEQKTIGEDEGKRGEEEIQKLTDQFIHAVDEALAAKENQLLAV